MPAILYNNTVWEGVSTEAFPSYEEGARDGHFFKQLDSGITFVRLDGYYV